jgi:hypothetical protein
VTVWLLNITNSRMSPLAEMKPSKT